MRKTEIYGLNQWDPEDPVLREDFNADNENIEAALLSLAASMPKIASGSYTGNGSNTSHTITFPFTPKIVFVYAIASSSAGGTFLYGQTSAVTYRSSNDHLWAALEWGEKSLTISDSSNTSSAQHILNSTYQYFWVALA